MSPKIATKGAKQNLACCCCTWRLRAGFSWCEALG